MYPRSLSVTVLESRLYQLLVRELANTTYVKRELPEPILDKCYTRVKSDFSCGVGGARALSLAAAFGRAALDAWAEDNDALFTTGIGFTNLTSDHLHGIVFEVIALVIVRELTGNINSLANWKSSFQTWVRRNRAVRSFFCNLLLGALVL